MKTCSKCQIPFPSAAFSKDASRADGLQNKCKACRRNRYIAHRREEILYAAAYIAKHADRIYPLKRAYNKANRKPVTPEMRQQYTMRHQSRHPEKVQARRLLRNAVKSGRIAKPGACSECLQAYPKAQIHGHHEDYSKPYDVTWLCATCHGRQHRVYAVGVEVTA